MELGLLTLGDHLPDPHTREYAETQAERLALWVELCVRAERGGFESCWIGEHHFNDYIVSSPQMLLTAVAVQTERIRLGTAVSLLANRDPVRFAEEFATLDLLSRGRAEVGLGSGITPHTFELFGQDPEHAHEIMDEHLELLKRIWEDERVDWQGKHRAPLRDARVEPRTYRGGRIPISIATGSSEEAAVRAGEAGHRLMIMTVYKRYQDFRTVADRYREAYDKAGHPAEDRGVAAVGYVHVRRDGKDAWNEWKPYVSNYVRFVTRLAKRQGLSNTLQQVQRETPQWLDERGRRESDICGNPQEVIDRLSGLSDALGGLDRFLCYFDVGCLPAGAVRESVDTFCEEVIPKLR
ncbi:MAG: LLM class flavin-dependent oxidoreductase [Myxococcales bacterium]|nr:LLM class flavin-dependent oxidoreductase [Myxococcales bacterium]